MAAVIVAFVATFVLATPASATHGQPGKRLPFTGVIEGTFTSLEYAPGFPVERSTFDGRCSVPSDIIFSIVGMGEGTHVGSFTGGVTDCGRVDLATGVVEYDGTGSWTAANGDTWNSTYVGTAFPDGTNTEEFTIVGGTGRFTGASGHGLDVGTSDMTAMPPTFVGKWEGWIAYDASQAS
jgi:hypothetical protein